MSTVQNDGSLESTENTLKENQRRDHGERTSWQSEERKKKRERERVNLSRNWATYSGTDQRSRGRNKRRKEEYN